MEVIVITGASEGIGAEMATQLARTKEAAVAVVLAARQASKLEAVANACRQHGAQVLWPSGCCTIVLAQLPCRTQHHHALLSVGVL